VLDYASIAYQALQTLWWLIPIALIIGVFKKSWFKGMQGEVMVKYAAKFRLAAGTYHPMHNLTLPTPDGSTQIDHVFVSRFGIFVVETKNMKGLILGKEHQAQWTQQFFKRSYLFQNPLRQNYKHIKALELALDVPAEAIHSVIVFVGASTFKSTMPVNVTHGWGFIGYIKSFRDVLLSEAEVQNTLAQITVLRLKPTRKTNRRHVKQLKARFDPRTQKKCPACGHNMVLRTAQRGGYAGRTFWGCSAYPSCRQVQAVS
jgi:hypothetical protein